MDESEWWSFQKGGEGGKCLKKEPGILGEKTKQKKISFVRIKKSQVINCEGKKKNKIAELSQTHFSTWIWLFDMEM